MLIVRRIFDMWRSDRTNAAPSLPLHSSSSLENLSNAHATPMGSISAIYAPSASLNNVSLAQNSRIKFVVLVLLCCQNAGHALLARYSQGVLKEKYSSTGLIQSYYA